MKECKYIRKDIEYYKGTAGGEGTKQKIRRCIISFRANKLINLFYKIFKCRNCKYNGGEIYYDN